MLAACAALACGDIPERALDTSYRVYELGGVDRLQRGDWIAPEAVVFVFEPEWLDELSQMIPLAAPETRVVLLADPRDWEVDEVREWISGVAVREDSVDILLVETDSPWIRDYGPLQAR